MIASQRGSIALHAPKNPEAVRDMIMRKREIAISHVKINDGISAPPLTTPQMTTTTTTKGVTNTQLTSTSVLFQDEKEQQELREIKESLLRIEEFGE